MRASEWKVLLASLLIYAVASLIHFVHNAEFIADYPNLPATWTRAQVYFAWVGMTAVGICGWFLATRGYELAGLFLIVVYAVLGIDSLGHYVVAPMSAHTLAMNASVLLDVIAAALVLLEAGRMIARRAVRRLNAVKSKGENE